MSSPSQLIILSLCIAIAACAVLDHRRAIRATDETDELLSELKNVANSADECEDDLNAAVDDLQQAYDVLNNVKTAYDNLNTLHGYLERLELACSAFQFFPYIGTLFSRIKSTVSTYESLVETAKDKVETLENKVATVRTQIENAQESIESAADLVDDIGDKATDGGNLLEKAIACLDELTDSDDVQSALNVAAEVLVLPVKAVDAIFSGCSVIGDAIDDVRSATTGTFTSLLDTLSSAVESVLDPFEIIDDIVSPIDAALNYEIEIPYFFEVNLEWPPWETTFEAVTFKFSIADILEGINVGIEWINNELIGAALEFLGLPSEIPLPSLPSFSIPDLDVDLPDVDGFIGTLDVDFDAPDTSCTQTTTSCTYYVGSGWTKQSYTGKEYVCSVELGGVAVSTGSCYVDTECKSSNSWSWVG